MRGKVSTIDTTPFTVGITPAYAGKRFRFERSQCRFWDHPRLCGEKIMSVMKLRNTSGSPPPMRGKVPSFLPVSAADGITPAYAGKRSRVDLCTTSSQDPPPPMRGKDGDSVRSRLPFRITPAYAGKSISAKNTSPRFKDHPRLCGEKYTEDDNESAAAGSPPPMRGKAFFTFFQEIVNGITPAYAGKSTLAEGWSAGT